MVLQMTGGRSENQQVIASFPARLLQENYFNASLLLQTQNGQTPAVEQQIQQARLVFEYIGRGGERYERGFHMSRLNGQPRYSLMLPLGKSNTARAVISGRGAQRGKEAKSS